MKLLCDPFLKRLLVALALYAAMIGLWMRCPVPASETLPTKAVTAPGPRAN